jgi:hypothetical protein
MTFFNIVRVDELGRSGKVEKRRGGLIFASVLRPLRLPAAGRVIWSGYAEVSLRHRFGDPGNRDTCANFNIFTFTIAAGKNLNPDQEVPP